MLNSPLRYPQLCEILDAAVESANLFYAIRVDGHFRHICTRSVPRQSKPYPPLSAVTEHQPVFNLYEMSGTLVGFRSPQFAKGMNVPGYHLHFLSDDRRAGGHVLALELERGRLLIDDTSNFHVELPMDETFLSAKLGGDRSKDVQKVEK